MSVSFSCSSVSGSSGLSTITTSLSVSVSFTGSFTRLASNSVLTGISFFTSFSPFSRPITSSIFVAGVYSAFICSGIISLIRLVTFSGIALMVLTAFVTVDWMVVSLFASRASRSAFSSSSRSSRSSASSASSNARFSASESTEDTFDTSFGSLNFSPAKRFENDMLSIWSILSSVMTRM